MVAAQSWKYDRHHAKSVSRASFVAYLPERNVLPARLIYSKPVIAFDAGAARAFGAVAGALRTAGRKKAARAYDALIAATAISEGLPPYTCNPDDFEGIPGLDLRIVPHPDAKNE